MKIVEAIQCWEGYHRFRSKENTLRSYRFILFRLKKDFGERDISSITSEEILSFLTVLTEHAKPFTRRTRYSYLAAFFNFIRNNVDPSLVNPCDTLMLRKLFRPVETTHWDILEKEVVDEIIFRTMKNRNRLMLELMARGGMRIGEVLKLTPEDINDRKLVLRYPKSGKEKEVVYIPQKLADRLKDYVRDENMGLNQHIFPMTYAGARVMVRKRGALVGVHLRPHDLRRHAATYASRSGVPIEIVSKVILRHSNLSTTQRYLGKVSDTEAYKWIEGIHG